MRPARSAHFSTARRALSGSRASTSRPKTRTAGRRSRSRMHSVGRTRGASGRGANGCFRSRTGSRRSVSRGVVPTGRQVDACPGRIRRPLRPLVRPPLTAGLDVGDDSCTLGTNRADLLCGPATALHPTVEELVVLELPAPVRTDPDVELLVTRVEAASCAANRLREVDVPPTKLALLSEPEDPDRVAPARAVQRQHAVSAPAGVAAAIPGMAARPRPAAGREAELRLRREVHGEEIGPVLDHAHGHHEPSSPAPHLSPGDDLAAFPTHSRPRSARLATATLRRPWPSQRRKPRRRAATSAALSTGSRRRA